MHLQNHLISKVNRTKRKGKEVEIIGTARKILLPKHWKFGSEDPIESFSKVKYKLQSGGVEAIAVTVIPLVT
ncbi:hypothetical protein K7X08_008058 [Anisodus acutangulus]|uniref:Uncharacterized protein n=1 Tax=Anisodus acutangulus TaxID=402998 RepID=A0A9Q1MPM1_9SOLA|nr:hypothetical protein K7X08_008058 [Anisodus acutangulus]